MLKILNIASLIILLTSCNTAKEMPEKNDESPELESSIFISQGGGFTGQYEQYLILVDGQVFEISSAELDRGVPLGTLQKSTADSLFELVSALNFSEAVSSAPGNMNYKLAVTKSGKKHELSWADDAKQKKDILQFFEYAFLEIKKLKL